VRLIAQRRYPHECCRVITNPGTEQNHGITYTTHRGTRRTVYPDIVALLKPDEEVAAVGEVETASTVTESAMRHWRLLAEHTPRFYLYVPVGAADAARELVADLDNAYLRIYRIDPITGLVIDDV